MIKLNNHHLDAIRTHQQQHLRIYQFYYHAHHLSNQSTTLHNTTAKMTTTEIELNDFSKSYPYNGQTELYAQWDNQIRRQMGKHPDGQRILSSHFAITTWTPAQEANLVTLERDLNEFQVQMGNNMQLQFQAQQQQLITTRLSTAKQNKTNAEKKIETERAIGIELLELLLSTTTGQLRGDINVYFENATEHPAINASKAFLSTRASCCPDGAARNLQATFEDDITKQPNITSLTALTSVTLAMQVILQRSIQTRNAINAHHASQIAAIQARILALNMELNAINAADIAQRDALQQQIATHRELSRKAVDHQETDNVPALTTKFVVMNLMAKMPPAGLLDKFREIINGYWTSTAPYEFKAIRDAIAHKLGEENLLHRVRQRGTEYATQSIMTTSTTTSNNESHSWQFQDKPHIHDAAVEHATYSWQTRNNPHSHAMSQLAPAAFTLDNDSFLQGKTAGLPSDEILAYNQQNRQRPPPFIQPPPSQRGQGSTTWSRTLP